MSSLAALLAMSVPAMLLLVAVAVVVVGIIAWLLPRPDASLSLRRAGDESTDLPPHPNPRRPGHGSVDQASRVRMGDGP
jgi:hypothetical protein